MSVHVRIPMVLRTLTGGRSVVSAEVGSLQDVITNLDTNYPGLTKRLLDDAGLRRFMLLELFVTE